jgi:hypothetical protein
LGIDAVTDILQEVIRMIQENTDFQTPGLKKAL